MKISCVAMKKKHHVTTGYNETIYVAAACAARLRADEVICGARQKAGVAGARQRGACAHAVCARQCAAVVRQRAARWCGVKAARVRCGSVQPKA